MPLYVEKAISGSSIPHLSYRRISRTSTSKRHMLWKSNMWICLFTFHPLIKQEKNHSGGHGSISLSPASCWFHNAHHAQCTCVQTSGTYRKVDTKMPAIFRLCSIARRRNCHLLSKGYETRNTLQCIVPIRTQGPQQSRRPHVHGRHRGHPHQQWSGSQYFADKKSSDVIGRRGQTGRIAHQLQNGGLDMMHTQGNRTPTNSHPNPNQQFDCSRTTHQQTSAQGVEDHGHAIPLVALLLSAGPVSILLETWNIEFGRLLDQASSSQPPQSFSDTNPNVCHHWSWEHQIENLEEHCNQVPCQEYSIDTIICGTIDSKTENNCSQRDLITQRQRHVQLAVSPSWGKTCTHKFPSKDIYSQPRPSLLGDRISHNAISAKAHSVVLWVTRYYYDSQWHQSKANTMGYLPIRWVDSLIIS